MGFVPTWLRRVSPLLHKTTLTTARGRQKVQRVDFACTVQAKSMQGPEPSVRSRAVFYRAKIIKKDNVVIANCQ